jgi:putative flippase GtrA
MRPRPVSNLLRKIYDSWATRSLAVGGVATLIDLAIGNTLLFVGHLSTAVSAMLALAVGSTVNFIGQRRFAFNEKKVATPATRWVLMTAAQIPIHGQLVHLFRDSWGVPFTFSKMIGDVIVFGILQLVVLRYLVFPKREEPALAATSAPSE